MSNQTKVTDYFANQKRTENPFRSAKKVNRTDDQLPDKESAADDQPVVQTKTPKRKKTTTADKVVKSSKRKKTPKPDVIIEFKSEAKHEVKAEPASEVEPKTQPKQLNAKQVKEKLGNCKNLLRLKQQLATINDCAAKVKQFKEIKIRTPTKKPLRTPTKSPSKFSPVRSLMSTTPITPITIPPLKSPISRLTPSKDSGPQTYRRRLFDVFEDESPLKVVDKNLAAFERFAYLVDKREENRSSTELVLPPKYKLLADMFKSMDTVVSMHYKRQEVCTFDRVKEEVQQMTRRKFDLKMLSQIHTVFDTAFKLKYQLFSTFLSNRKPSYQLVITPVYNSNVNIKQNPNHLLERYRVFVGKLLDITKAHHNKYLSGLGVASVANDQLVRWHPKFRLESVPDIVANDNALPPEPKFGDQSAETFLENTRQRLGIQSTNKTEQKPLESNDNQSIDNKPISDSSEKVTKGRLKGISMDLLNRIRAKEAANLALEMTRKPEVETELRILNSLPEFIRIIHSYFVGSNKLAAPYDELVNKLVASFNTSLSIVRAREHVDYLCRWFPDWISLLQVKRGNYIKIKKEASLTTLDKRIATKVAILKKVNN